VHCEIKIYKNGIFSLNLKDFRFRCCGRLNGLRDRYRMSAYIVYKRCVCSLLTLNIDITSPSHKVQPTVHKKAKVICRYLPRTRWISAQKAKWECGMESYCLDSGEPMTLRLLLTGPSVSHAVLRWNDAFKNHSRISWCASAWIVALMAQLVTRIVWNN